MKLGDKTTYEKNGFIYQAIVIAVSTDNTKVKLSVQGSGECVIIDNN